MKQDIAFSKSLWFRLGALMRREREASGLSVRRIQSISGVHYRTMYAYERGEYEGGIMLNKYMAICAAIGADPAELLEEALMGEAIDGREGENEHRRDSLACK